MTPAQADLERDRLLAEQVILREFVQHPGARLLAAKLRTVSRQGLKKQLDCDPYKEPDEIKRQQQLRYVLNILLPQLIEGIVNYAPEMPDKQVPVKRRWKILEWFKP